MNSEIRLQIKPGHPLPPKRGMMRTTHPETGAAWEVHITSLAGLEWAPDDSLVVIVRGYLVPADATDEERERVRQA